MGQPQSLRKIDEEFSLQLQSDPRRFKDSKGKNLPLTLLGAMFSSSRSLAHSAATSLTASSSSGADGATKSLEPASWLEVATCRLAIVIRSASSRRNRFKAEASSWPLRCLVMTQVSSGKGRYETILGIRFIGIVKEFIAAYATAEIWESELKNAVAKFSRVLDPEHRFGSSIRGEY
ncbi:hypothetical protein PanWU01x14_252210 [Parasponia andersonii]|uniref:Uncharacterized protein n=1 Tax=Parasponia andersonii TaxID=3476 RepID=A0A2P5BC24_PARAD|nr:hypothetical protein PanWU01x14_252210 [Parasponia andersonii]